MISMLRQWKGPVEINGQKYENIDLFISGNTDLEGSINIKLYPEQQKVQVEDDSKEEDKTYRVTVKQYMTKPSEPGFDFMAKWNEDKPMPMRTMTGTLIKETRGMVQMHLKGFGEATCNCLRCGKSLNNPISRHYGIGPDCMAKLGLVRDINDVDGIKEDLQEIEWRGWIIKSAITEWEEVNEYTE